ncbi:MAG: hypothetical protein HRU19_18955 [Pseudobacteriovorax sp.]|nr:hypothetical protein [Pseudobacteriovorax sp.]
MIISIDGKAKVYRTPHGNYRIRFTDATGKSRNKVVKTATDKAALVRAIKKRISLAYWFPAEKVNDAPTVIVRTFEDLAKMWLEHSEKVREISKILSGDLYFASKYSYLTCPR